MIHITELCLINCTLRLETLTIKHECELVSLACTLLAECKKDP